MTPVDAPDRSRATALLLSLPILTAVIHLAAAAAGGYGLFRDELYYIACANHPDTGYVDQPPLSIWILSAWKLLSGDSLFSVRVLPALFHGIAVFIVGRLAGRLGGGRYAVALACLASMLAPILIGFFGIFNMNVFDIVLWGSSFLVTLDITRSGGAKRWLMLGVLIGLGALNKISMLWLGAGIFAGVLLTPHRVSLRTAAPWIACIIAAAMFLPYVVWNVTHDFAHLEFIRNASAEKYASQTPLTFFSGLLMSMNPIAAPVWLAGFWFLLSRREFRVIGYAVLTVLAILLINIHSKAEYFTAAMTALLPAGAVQIERWLDGPFTRRLRMPYAAIIALTGIALVPLSLDILPVETYIAYQSAIGVEPESNEGLGMGVLPQHYADRHGWPGMAGVVAGVYASLPDSEKSRCLVYGRNYGEAAAVDYYGRAYGLPPAVSQHNSYWFWSLDHLRQDMTLIVIGVPREDLLDDFMEVDSAGVVRSAYAMPYENGLTVSVCRKLRRPFRESWAGFRLFM